jgi:hypothetical protein
MSRIPEFLQTKLDYGAPIARHAIIVTFQLLLYKIPLKTRGYPPGEGEEI